MVAALAKKVQPHQRFVLALGPAYRSFPVPEEWTAMMGPAVPTIEHRSDNTEVSLLSRGEAEVEAEESV
jgi:hypothetical protein